MEKKKITKEEFLHARQHLRQRFNALSPLIHDGKIWVNNAQRNKNYSGEDPSDDSKGFGLQWSFQSTLLATALAHSRNRIHMKTFQSYMPGHAVDFNTLEDQENFLSKSIRKFEECRQWSPIDATTLDMMKLVAFSERPIPEPREKISIKEEDLTCSISVPSIVEMESVVGC